jgi:hypothetical protein
MPTFLRPAEYISSIIIFERITEMILEDHVEALAIELVTSIPPRERRGAPYTAL